MQNVFLKNLEPAKIIGNIAVKERFFNMEKRQKKQLAILDVLNRSGQVLSSTRITELLVAQDVDISERSVRTYLCELDEEGLTENLGRRGRIITEKGRHEADASRVLEGIGLLSGKIDAMAYQMDFDPALRRGTVVVNVSAIPIKEFTDERRTLIEKVFAVDDTLVRIYHKEAEETLTYSLPEYSKYCLHNTALGKAYLSSLPEDLIAEKIAYRQLRPYID